MKEGRGGAAQCSDDKMRERSPASSRSKSNKTRLLGRGTWRWLRHSQGLVLAAACSLILVVNLCAKGVSCVSCELTHCAAIVHPLLKEPKYIIPSNVEEVDYICNTLFPQTWSSFVACIKDYSSSCMNADERTDINRAVGDSINSVHKICTNVDYRREYFEYAPCIRERISSELYCNGEYDKLIASVEQESNSTDLCCNHHGFKECLVSQSVSCCPQCGRRASEASDYARMFLDKALGFVAQECNRAGHTATTCAIGGVVETELVRQEHYDGPDYFPNGGGGDGAAGGSGRGGGSSVAAAVGDLSRETPFVPVAPTTERGQRQSDIDSDQIGDSAYQTFTEWIDEEKVEEFNEFLDNQLQSKLGRGYNSAVGSASASWTATLSSVILMLLLYDNRQI